MDYVPHTPADEAHILATIGVDSFEDLLHDIPAGLRETARPDIADGLSESDLWAHMTGLAATNRPLVCFRGAGAYDHYVPAVIGSLLSRTEFLTGYTPYQAELSQGMLTTIYEYQSHIQRLTGMEVANASMYDGASAMAEAALMALRTTGHNRVLMSDGVPTPVREVVQTYVQGLGVEIVSIPLRDGVTDATALADLMDDNTAAVLISQPNALGQLEDLADLYAQVPSGEKTHPLRVAMVHPLAMGIITPPGELGADVVVGEGQPLGVSMTYGGPGVGFFATRMAYVRQLPGRLVGRTLDTRGHEGFCLTFQTREQHIRREKATSNICSNQALLALANTIYLSYLGPRGIAAVAADSHGRAADLARRIGALPGWSVPLSGPFFHEFVVAPPIPPAEVNARLSEAGYLGGHELGTWRPEWQGWMLFCVTERRTPAQIDELVKLLGHMGGT